VIVKLLILKDFSSLTITSFSSQIKRIKERMEFIFVRSEISLPQCNMCTSLNAFLKTSLMLTSRCRNM